MTNGEKGGTRKKVIAPDTPWQDLPRGGVIPHGGNAEEYETGDWRSRRPVYDAEECIQCRLCWVFCPDSAVDVNEDGEVVGIIYKHCKGCGICATECPSDGAIEMVSEEE